MKKVVALLLFLLLITGCKVQYNITINEDLSLVEEAKLTGTKDFFDSYYKTTKTNVLKSFIDIYKDTLEKNNYEYELISGDNPFVNIKKTYTGVSDFVNNSILFNDYFDEVKYTENGDVKRIETVGYNPNEPDNPNRFEVNSLEIIIQTPYKVKENNAIKVDKSTNTYYYELNEENNKIIFEYDISSKFNPYSDVIKTVIICIAIIIVIWFVIFILNKKEKK